MTLETFFQKFDQFADAPDAVAKMRELVLELAVQGRLVDQKLSDGNAAQLIAVISSERNKRAAKLRTPNDPEPVDGNEQAFPIPSNWEWTQLGLIALQIQYGYTASADPSATEVRMLRITDIQNNRVDWPSVPGCQIESDEAEKYLLSPNDILIARTGGTIGKSFIVPDAPVKSVFASYLIRVTPPRSIAARYLKIFLESPLYWSQLRQMSAGTGQPNVNGQALGRLALPLPPLAEQKRIVAKVDELMTLCDRLEAQQQERETRHAALARASLARFAEAPTPANLDWIFHPSYPIPPADLRKAILTLAVQGKLVPQDPNDEPTEELAMRVDRDRALLAKAQGVRLPKNVPPLTSNLYPHDIPESWQWSRIGNLALVIDYGTSQKADSDSSKVPVYRMGNIVGGRLIDENLKYVDATIDDLPGLYLKTDDILFNRTNSYELVGKAGIYKGPDDTATFASYLIRIRLPQTLLFPQFFSMAMNAPYYRQTQIEPEVVQQCGQANFNGTKLSATVVPLPPLAEQRRIVAKVDQLMALVDALETQLAASRATAAKLLSALVAELTAAAPSSAPASRADAPVMSREPEFIRSVFAAEVIDRLHAHETFGQVKLQKVLHLAEYIFQLPEIDSHPLRYAAGPHDPQLIREVEHGLRARDWFSTEPRSDGPGHVYRPLAGSGAHRDAFTQLWPEQAPRIRAFLDELRSWKTERCERFATLYAAWNDLLIWGQEPTDPAILDQVLEKWDPAKKRIPSDLWLDSLHWMRDHGYTPTGFGRATQSAPQAELFLG